MTTRPLANGRNVGVISFFTHLKLFQVLHVCCLLYFLMSFWFHLAKQCDLIGATSYVCWSSWDSLGASNASIDVCAEAHRWSCIFKSCDNMPHIGYTVRPGTRSRSMECWEELGLNWIGLKVNLEEGLLWFTWLENGSDWNPCCSQPDTMNHKNLTQSTARNLINARNSGRMWVQLPMFELRRAAPIERHPTPNVHLLLNAEVDAVISNSTTCPGWNLHQERVLARLIENSFSINSGNAALKEHRGIGPAPGVLSRLCELGLHIRK